MSIYLHLSDVLVQSQAVGVAVVSSLFYSWCSCLKFSCGTQKGQELRHPATHLVSYAPKHILIG